ncbi:MAG: T9SS type A sorting domain-containing protein [Candidatus Eisenbacteria bacterium]
MRIEGRSVRLGVGRLVLFLLLTILGLSNASAQALDARLTANTEVTFASDRYTYAVTVTNKGSSDLLSVSADVTIPQFINSFGDSPGTGLDCASTTCDPGEVGTWTVGTLAAGESRTTYFTVQVQAGAPETLISNSLLASAPGQSDVEAVMDVAVDPTPLLRLGLAPGSGPVVPGAAFPCVLSFGNIGTAAPGAVELRADVPAGMSFVSASDGGVLNGGQVVWSIGLLGPGAGGEVELELLASAGLEDGDIIDLRAELDPNLGNEYTVTSAAAIPVRASNPLHLEYTVSQSALGSGIQLTYSLTAGNTGPVDLADVACAVQIPRGLLSFNENLAEGFDCPSTTCESYEIATWAVGTLRPGETRTYQFRTTLATATPGDVRGSCVVGNATGASEVFAWRDVVLDPTPLFDLSLSTANLGVEPGAEQTIVLTYGNVGSTATTDAALRFRIPEHTTFVSASAGGTRSGDFVMWDLGTLGLGAGGAVRVTIRSDADLPLGSLLFADAELDSGLSGEYVIHANLCLTVTLESPLEIVCSVSQESAEKGGELTYLIQASNSGPSDLKNTVVRMLLPNELASVGEQLDEGWDCPSTTCESNEIAVWNVGVLQPGESRVIVHRTFVNTGARSGAVLRGSWIASSATTDQTAGRIDVSADPTPSMRLSLSPSQSPVASGDVYRYRLVYANRGTTSPSDVELRLHVPGGVTIVDATGGVTATADVVTWKLGAVGPGAGGEVSAFVRVDEMQDGGSLAAWAELDTHVASEYVLRASSSVAVQNEMPLRLSAAVDQGVAAPGDLVTYHVVVANDGVVDLNDIAVRIRFPGNMVSFGERLGEGFDCPSTTCDSHEIAIWSIDSLLPGESRDLFYQHFTQAATPQGEILRSAIVARASSTGSVIVEPTVSNDVSPLMSLGIAGTGPADPNEDYRFVITYGNLDGTPITGLLRFELPEGMTFLSASGDGFEHDGVVSWGTGLLGLGDGGQVTCLASFDGSVQPGQLFKGYAELDTGASTEYRVRSEYAFALREANPLELRVTADRASVAESDSVYYQFEVTNHGTVNLTSVSVLLTLPYEILSFSDPAGGIECPSTTCDPGELASWDIGTLGVGQTELLAVPTKLAASLVDGGLVRLSAWSFAEVANEVNGDVEILIGDFIDTETSDAPDSAGPLDGAHGSALDFAASCFPSPVSSRAEFSLTSPRSADVRVDMYDVSGRLVDTVFDGRMDAGRQRVTWDATEVASGVYLYRMVTGGRVVDQGTVVKVQ